MNQLSGQHYDQELDCQQQLEAGLELQLRVPDQ
jgi:hypothetical protein